MPGKNVELIEVIHFASTNYVRVVIGFKSATSSAVYTDYRTVDMRLDCRRFAGRELAARKLRVLSHACLVDKGAGDVRPYTAGLVGWVWARYPLEGS